MFDSIKKVFEKFSFTDEESSDIKRYPILSNRNMNYCFKVLTNYVNNNNFKDVIIKADYGEIYYVDDIYEVTLILLSNEENKTLVSCHVLSSKRGKSREKLYAVLDVVNKVINERVSNL